VSSLSSLSSPTSQSFVPTAVKLGTQAYGNAKKPPQAA
jgi:hypothetical protein